MSRQVKNKWKIFLYFYFLKVQSVLLQSFPQNVGGLRIRCPCYGGRESDMGAPFPPGKKPEVLSFVRTLILNEKNPDLSADDGAAAEREKNSYLGEL